jgi:hypothetical protein
MKTKLFLLFAICYLPIALFAQTSQTGSDYIARRVQIPLLDAPQKVQNASVFVSGNPGPATYYYWIVTNGLAGASSPAGPFQIGNAPNTLSVSNFNQISWNNALGAVSFDVLRTSNPSPPFGACNCAVATAVAGSSTSDQANALNAYTVNTFDPSTVLWAITNESVSAGVSQITFRAGGFAKFSLASNGAAVTLATPLTCAAHQFFTALSGGGVFTCTQPASADISDGTGTGVVARATNAALTTPSISSPTTTGTDNGVETLGQKTLNAPIIGTTTMSEAPRMVLVAGFQVGNLAVAIIGSGPISKPVTVEAIQVHSSASTTCTVNPTLRVRNAGSTVTTPTLTLTTGTSDWSTTGNAVNYAGSDILFIEITSAGTCTTPPANIVVNVTGRMQ